MKKIKLSLLQLSLVTFVYSQTNTFPTSGNTGIGTTSPTSPFTIRTTLNQGDPIFDFGNPQQYNQILFKDRDFSSFLFGLRSSQIDIGTPNNDHKIMSIQSNANNITLWPTFSINSGANIIMNPSQNVGVGTGSPNYKLDVNGSVNATQFLINGSPIGSLNTLWLNNSSGIYYNGSGNVGIGTTAPSAPLEIGNTVSQGSPIFKFGNPQQYNQITFRDRDISSFLFGVEANQIRVGASGNDHKIMSIQANSQNIELWPTVAINSPNNIIINAGQNVGIGNSNPQYKLDVTGDMRVSSNLFVGGGVITSQTVNAGSKINAGDLDATGNLNIAGISTFNGHSNFNGTLRIAGFNQAGSLAVDINGNVLLNPPPPPYLSCIPGSPQWSIGGDNFVASQSAFPPFAISNEPSVGTCNDFDFILKANAVNRVWLKTDGKIGFGTSAPSEVFHFTGGNILLDGGGNASLIGGNIFLSDVNAPTGNQNRFYVKAGNNLGSLIETNHNFDFGINTQISVNRATTKAISQINTDPNATGENFVLWGDGRTYIGKNMFAGNGSMLTVGQPSKTDLALSLVDNTSQPGNSFFNVYGSGYTEINVYSPNTMPQPSGGSPRAFAIKDLANNKDLFVVNATGKTYAREVEISLATTFPDYVFNKDYKLAPLNEVDSFIKQNKHLPGFEKGEYYEKNGVNVTDIMLKQQRAIEELTLYQINAEKTIISLEKRLAALENKTQK